MGIMGSDHERVHTQEIRWNRCCEDVTRHVTIRPNYRVLIRISESRVNTWQCERFDAVDDSCRCIGLDHHDRRMVRQAPSSITRSAAEKERVHPDHRSRQVGFEGDRPIQRVPGPSYQTFAKVWVLVQEVFHFHNIIQRWWWSGDHCSGEIRQAPTRTVVVGTNANSMCSWIVSGQVNGYVEVRHLGSIRDLEGDVLSETLVLIDKVLAP